VVRTLTTAGACTGTRLAAYHLWLSAARITTTGTCTSLLAIEMHTTILKTGTKNEIVSSANDIMRRTMIIMDLITTSPIGTVLWLEDAMKGGSNLSLTT
jgi:hypothetical protein